MDYNLSALPVTPVKQKKAIPVINKSEQSSVLVKACGKTLRLDMQCANSLLSLQKTLQQELQIEALPFAFFDVNGIGLSSDSQLQDAVAKAKMPLSARMTNTTILELGQKQWMLMRDQMTVVSGQMNAISRQVDDTQAQLQQFKQEVEGMREVWKRDRGDVCNLMEKQETFQKITDSLQDQHVIIAKTLESLRTPFLDTITQIDTIRAEFSNTSQEASVRLKEVEEGFATLQNRISVLSSRQASSHMGLAERHERLSQAVESLKLEEKQKQNHMEASLDRMKALEASVEEIHQMIAQEREEQGDQILRSHRDLHAEHQRQMKALECQIAASFKQESEEQEGKGQVVAEVRDKSPDTFMRSIKSPDTIMRSSASPPLSMSVPPSRTQSPIASVRRIPFSSQQAYRATRPTSPMVQRLKSAPVSLSNSRSTILTLASPKPLSPRSPRQLSPLSQRQTGMIIEAHSAKEKDKVDQQQRAPCFFKCSNC